MIAYTNVAAVTKVEVKNHPKQSIAQCEIFSV